MEDLARGGGVGDAQELLLHVELTGSRKLRLPSLQQQPRGWARAQPPKLW